MNEILTKSVGEADIKFRGVKDTVSIDKSKIVKVAVEVSPLQESLYTGDMTRQK